MLLVARKMKELNFPQLMDVYVEGNEENGAAFWPEESPERQLQLAEEDFRSFLVDTFFQTVGAVYCVWQAQGRYTAALRLEPYRDGWLLEGLETAPAQRRKGYAQALMQSVLLLPEYGKVYSHVAKGNAASLKVHQNCGFQRISEQAVYIDGSVDERCCTLCYSRC